MSNRGSKKKENHQNLTLKMMGTSNQVQLWRYSRTRALFLPQKSLYEAKKRVSNTTPKNFPGSYERVFMVTKIQISKINCIIKSILSGLVARRLYFFQKLDIKQQFSPSCRIWPICCYHISSTCKELLSEGTHVPRRPCSSLLSSTNLNPISYFF